jgi:probable rRNA maturation factor
MRRSLPTDPQRFAARRKQVKESHGNAFTASVKLTFSLSQSLAARKLKPPRGLKQLLKEVARTVIQSEFSDLKQVSLGVVLYNDKELLALNISSLGHDWYTDILTFEIDRTDDKLEAELYLSLERAAENAKKRRKSVDSELALLVIHGLLHLAGMDDHEALQKKRMARRERFFLAKFRDRLP